MRHLRAAAVAALTLCSVPLLAADFDTGMTAFRAGDYAAALSEWRPLAEEGVPEAQYGLALMYENGYGVTKDETKAVDWYRKAAEQGDANAQFMMGVMYGRGTAVERDPIQRLVWYRRAAEQGHLMAQVFLALGYFEGEVAPPDPVIAYFWAKVAADNMPEANSEEIEDLLGRISATLSPEQIAEGDQRVEMWHGRNTAPQTSESAPPAAAATGAGTEPARPVSAEEAARVTGAWELRVNRQSTDTPPDEVVEDFNDFAVTIDHAADGVLVGSIHLPDGSDSPLENVRTDGRQLSFTFRARDVVGTLSGDGSTASGLLSAGGLEYTFTMSRVAD